MRLKKFAFLLLITFYSQSLLSEKSNKSNTFNYENNIQNTLSSKNVGEIIIHIVKKGDTLSSISREYSINKESIIKVNKLPDENYIFIGQNLKIVENLIPESKINAYYHEVKKGENLTEIANKYNLSLSELVEINGIENQNILEVGTTLKLKEKIAINKNSPINEAPDLTIKDNLLNNKYGPLVIEYEKTNHEKRKNFLKATHKNGKKFILHINCQKKEINVRGIGRKWKGWMLAREEFEIELLNDFCREFD
tara:strand:- start:102 stop:857 length:756 start_codon:yes stop_codon:yes gene_type:complete